ncbi:unnamed protein product [Strongylus vulgaris]|uniref:Choline transporter-like protein n=1 Tax=Strongylus vulgaris TaxID=40348 RepID=A0A3P7IN76_STRVU|nr:unnamed protein product [Strongylus vulgaris]
MFNEHQHVSSKIFLQATMLHVFFRDYRNRPYLYYFDITKCISYTTALGGCQTPQMCVAACPSKYFSYLQLQNPTITSEEFRQTVASSVYCLDTVNISTITSFLILRAYVQQQKCASYTVKSAPVLGRCVPEILIGAADSFNSIQQGNTSLDTLKNMFGDDGSIPPDKALNDSEKYIGQVVNSEGVITKIVHDLSKSWWQIATLVVAAGVLAFLWTVVLRILGGFMIWTSIIAILAVLGAGCGYSWFKWNTLRKVGAVDDFSFQPIFSVYFEMPTTWLIVAITASIALLILLLVLLFIRKRISIAVALIEESSRAVGHMMSTLIFPIFPFALHLLVRLHNSCRYEWEKILHLKFQSKYFQKQKFKKKSHSHFFFKFAFKVIALWGTIAIWLASSGVETCVRNDGRNTTCDCSTSAQDSSCLFIGLTKQESTVFWLQVYNLFAFFWMTCFVTSLGMHVYVILYNLGSLAFGSLIIAIIKVVRVILDYLDKKMATTKSAVMKSILSALKCCFWCMEVFFKFLTKNAFIMMAVYGKNFFTSAKDSFMLLVRNCVRAAVVNQVAGILLFLGKALITLGMEMIGVVRTAHGHVSISGSYFVADLFFDVYEMAVDTTFICFLEDSEQNDGSPEKPFYMSKNLQSILDVKNTK